MISSKDEIIRIFASLEFGNEDLPFAEPDDVEEIPFANPEDVIEVPQEPPEPVSMPEESKLVPYSYGSPQWLAGKYPYAYLTASLPYRGYIHGQARSNITRRLLENMIATNPGDYFDLDIGPAHKLNELEDLDKFKYRAAKSLIVQDPQGALVRGISYMRGLDDLLPELWTELISKSDQFPGILHYRMKHLAKRIAETDPEFYQSHIAGSDIEQRLMRPTPAYRSHGSAKWLAESYPRTYLKGVRKLGESNSHILDDRNERATAAAMNKIIETDPIKYFAWGLNRQKYLQKYSMLAADSLVDKDPEAALLWRLYKNPEFASLLPKLWDKIKELGEARQKNGQMPFPGIVYSQVRSLIEYAKKMQGILQRS